MGYDLHITRRDFWADDGNEIPKAEWLTYAQTQPNLRVAEADEVWLSPAKGEDWPIWWFQGTIDAKNPPDSVIQEMAHIALALDATLQGDDGEHYDTNAIRSDPHPPSPKPGFLSRLFGKSQ